MATLI